MEAATDEMKTAAAERNAMPSGLAHGLPNHWYPILRAEELGEKPVACRRFAEDLAVWRNAAGAPRVFENHCPHRLAPLSLGKISGDELACPYHGWRFGGSGACVSMPLEQPSPAVLARHSVKSYPAEERGGYIWMFYGRREDVTPLQVPPELEDTAWLAFKTEYVWKTNWINVLDNVIDPLHAIFLHAGAVTQRKRARFKEFRITKDDDAGFRLGKLGIYEDGSVGPVEGEVEFLLPNVMRLDIANGTQQGIYRVVIMPTPIDDDTACAFYVRTRRTDGVWSRLQWRLWWAMHGRAVHAVAAQDREVLEGLGPVVEGRRKEHLAVSDTGVARLRRRIQQAYHGEHNRPSHDSVRGR